MAEEGDRQIATMTRPDDVSEEQFAERMRIAREQAFRVTITIGGWNSADIFGHSAELFSSPNLPDNIAYIFMTNSTAYQGFTGHKPTDSFSLNLDFGKPPLLDGNNPVSSPTPNNSNLQIEGERDAWVSTINGAVMGVLETRKNHRGWLHAAFVYDLGLWTIAMPVGMWAAWKSSGLVETAIGTTSGFLAAAAYLYLFFVVVWCYRIFFGYTKWVFPLVELKENEKKSAKHRAFWSTIFVGLIGKAIWEVASIW